jgi:hypothetical protein
MICRACCAYHCEETVQYCDVAVSAASFPMTVWEKQDCLAVIEVHYRKVQERTRAQKAAVCDTMMALAMPANCHPAHHLHNREFHVISIPG